MSLHRSCPYGSNDEEICSRSCHRQTATCDISDTAWIALEEQTATEFQRWLAVTNGITSLAQQVALAKQLYDEVHGPEEVDVSVEDIIARLRTVELAPVDDLVRWKGIQVEWFLDVFCNTAYVQRLLSFGCELWFVRKVCIIEMLRREQISAGAFIDHLYAFRSETSERRGGACPVRDTATLFLSYTGRCSFAHFVSMLGQLKGHFIWMDK